MSIPTNTGYDDMANELSRLRSQLDKAHSENERLNEKLRERNNEPDDSGFREKFRKLRKEMEEAEDDRQALRSQTKKLKRENQELLEDLEDLNNRMKDMRTRASTQVDGDQLRRAEKEAQDAWEKKKKAEDDLEEMRRRLEDLENRYKEEKDRLLKEKEEAVEKTYKTIVELKTENEDELEKLREDLLGKDKIIKSLMDELRKIKDYISKLEREIFDLSQEKEKLEENLKKVMYEWENEEMKRYSSDKQITGKLKGKDEEIDELKEKLQQIDSYHNEAKNEISRKADFYKKKSENLEKAKNNLQIKFNKLEKTLKNKMENDDGGRGSHVEIGSIGVRTMENRSDLGKTKDTLSGQRAEGDYEYERSQQISKTVKMDGDLVKMLYTQAKFIEDRFLEQPDSDEEEEEEEEEVEEEYEQYVQGQPQMYIDNTQSSNPQRVFANANRVVVDQNGEKYLIESEADDGDKLVAAYMVNNEFIPINQMGGAIPQNQVIQVNEGHPNMVHHGGMEGSEDEYEDQNELIEDEYSDMEEEEMYEQQENQDQVGNGHLVQGPVGGGRREGYEGSEHEEDYEEEGEEEFEDGEYEEDFRLEQEQDQDQVRRKPGLTFGMVKQ